jgi:hypothetical protein
MANDDRKQAADQSRQPGSPSRRRPSVAETEIGHPDLISSVISIQGWKRRTRDEKPSPTEKMRPTKKDVPPWGRAYKQATLLRLILSDTIAEADLDAMIDTVASLVRRRGGLE